MSNDSVGRVFVLSHGDAAVTDAVVRTLEADGWGVVLERGQADAAADALPEMHRPVHGVVYVPGLLDGVVHAGYDPATALLQLVGSLRPHLPPTAHGGARVVAVGSRDWLGWPTRPRVAAQAAALVATVRSLALAHGQAGITVNAVVGMSAHAASRRDDGPAPGTHLYEPVPLSGVPVSAEDIAASVAFFLDPRSGYITGQILHCCGGASLLSSLSV
ncbi:MAG: SDR family oxidoreductase [Actinobacteria bacterium]|nr:SDR family oxidoreductase [Actinomycetota bacterium]